MGSLPRNQRGARVPQRGRLALVVLAALVAGLAMAACGGQDQASPAGAPRLPQPVQDKAARICYRASKQMAKITAPATPASSPRQRARVAPKLDAAGAILDRLARRLDKLARAEHQPRLGAYADAVQRQATAVHTLARALRARQTTQLPKLTARVGQAATLAHARAVQAGLPCGQLGNTAVTRKTATRAGSR